MKEKNKTRKSLVARQQSMQRIRATAAPAHSCWMYSFMKLNQTELNLVGLNVQRCLDAGS